MKTDHATEHLQTIRMLMERSALYRRALAPLMTFAGGLGIAAAVIGCAIPVEELSSFIIYWYVIALIGLTGSLLLVRRQAIQTGEPFWSPPARRIAQAISPALMIGFFCGVYAAIILSNDSPMADRPTGEYDDARYLSWLVAVWAILHGCGLHAASFFTSRGLRRLGWVFMLAGNAILAWLVMLHKGQTHTQAWWHSHILMGALFGVLQLAYGIYLFATGEEKNEQ